MLGLAGELRGKGIAVNALWPRTTIATAAINNLLGGEALMRASRTPEILADVAHTIFLKDARQFSGNFLIDDTFLFENGVRDFDRYRVDPSVDLAPDFFVPEEPEATGRVLARIAGSQAARIEAGITRSGSRRLRQVTRTWRAYEVNSRRRNKGALEDASATPH